MVLAGLVLAGVIWYSFLRDKKPKPLIQATDVTQTNGADSDVVSTLLQLRAVSLSGTIFSEPAFMSLLDFGSQIVPEPVGRPNPFAPLGPNASTSPAKQTSSPAKQTKSR